MNTKQKFAQAERNVVYVKEVATLDLSEDLRAAAGDQETLFSVHDAQGVQLALVANRTLAFHLALENEMVPLTVH